MNLNKTYKYYLLVSVSALLLASCEPLPSKEETQQSIIKSELLRKNGNSLIASGDFKEAVKVFDQLIELDLKNALAYNGKAIAFDHSGNHLAAQDIYKTALALSPDSLPIKNNLAMSLILNQQPKQAIELLEPLVLNNSDKSTNSNIMRHNLALAYGISKRYKEATKLNLRDMTEEQASENTSFYKNYNLENATILKKKKKNNHNIGFITSPSPSSIANNKDTTTKPKTSPKTISKVKNNSTNLDKEPTFIGLPATYEYPK
jgi:Tfp pilus assembly protein PilF